MVAPVDEYWAAGWAGFVCDRRYHLAHKPTNTKTKKLCDVNKRNKTDRSGVIIWDLYGVRAPYVHESAVFYIKLHN